MKRLTTDPIQPSNVANTPAEFGRVGDLNRLFGLRRGSAYSLLKRGKIQGVLLRVAGQKSGVRLFSLDSVRNFIQGEMAREVARQNGASEKHGGDNGLA